MRSLSSLGLGLGCAFASVLVLSNQAQAEERAITQQDVEGYLEAIQQEAVEIVRDQDGRRMVEWIERNIAEGAVFQVSFNVVHGDQPKGFASLTLDRDDMLRVGGVFAGAFQQQGIEDYSLQMELGQVIAHGSSAATVQVRWTETLALASGKEPGAGQVTIEQVADCSHIIERTGEDDRLRIGLSTCTGEMRF